MIKMFKRGILVAEIFLGVIICYFGWLKELSVVMPALVAFVALADKLVDKKDE